MYANHSINVSTALAIAVLSLGVLSSAPAGASDGCGATYTIKAGDSLGKIAKRCGTTVNGIITANDRIRNASQISVGWTIQLPIEEVGTVLPANPTQTATTEETELSGLIVNSRSCAQLKTKDGEVYGLVSRKVMFRSGQAVTVRGALIKKAGCSADRVLRVSELETQVN